MRRLAILVILIATGPQIRAQAPATYRIAGKVVSSVDNHPLQRATVDILSTPDRKVAQTVSSDEFGRFAFTGVPAGTFILRGNAPGYVATEYEQHDGFDTGIATGTGVDTESLVLKVRAEGTITGTILDESAEPVDHAQVRLFRQTHAYGDSRIISAGIANTNDLGRFEVLHLQPGTYFLAVSATPWYATHPDPAAASPADYMVSTRGQQLSSAQMQAYNRGLQALQAMPTVSSSVDPTLDVAYPVTYYPGGTDSADATPILIRGGNAVELNMELKARAAITLTIPHAAGESAQPQNGRAQVPPPPLLRTSVFGQLEFINGQESRQTATGTVISGLAPGDYTLSDPRSPVNQSSAQSGTSPVLHLTERSSTATMPTAPDLAHLHVYVKAAGGATLPAQTRIGLARGVDTAVTHFTEKDKTDATFDAPPGDYYFSIAGGTRQLYVRGILAGDQPLPSNDIHLAPGATASFTVTVIPGTHTLKGVARKDGKPAAGAFILLIPTAELHDIRHPYRQQSDLDGSWDIANLAPGEYTLLAIGDGWDLDWLKPAVLSRYLPAAVTVEIPGTDSTVQTLTEPLTVQPK